MGGKDASSSPAYTFEAAGPEETEGALGSCEDSTRGSLVTVPSAGGELSGGAELSGSGTAGGSGSRVGSGSGEFAGSSVGAETSSGNSTE